MWSAFFFRCFSRNTSCNDLVVRSHPSLSLNLELNNTLIDCPNLKIFYHPPHQSLTQNGGRVTKPSQEHKNDPSILSPKINQISFSAILELLSRIFRLFNQSLTAMIDLIFLIFTKSFNLSNFSIAQLKSTWPWKIIELEFSLLRTARKTNV